MLIGSRQRLRSFVHSPSLNIGGAQISQVPSTKSLGIYIDENLTGMFTSRIYLRRLLRVLGPWSGFDLLFLIERCDLFTILWWNLVLITVTLSRVTVIKLLPINSKSYKTVLLESWPPLHLIPVLNTFFKCWIGESLNLSARYKKLAWWINL